MSLIAVATAVAAFSIGTALAYAVWVIRPLRGTGHRSVGELARVLKETRATLQEHEQMERTIGRENELARRALDAMSSNVRVVDNEGTILFMNKTLIATVEHLEPEIKRGIPAFDRTKLMGGSIGIFYSDPAAALGRLRQINQRLHTALKIGGRQFDIVTTPLFAANGERIGTVGEWVDVQNRVDAQVTLEALIDSAARGDFSRRINPDELHELFRKLAEGVNTLMETTRGGLTALSGMLADVADGRLDRRLDAGAEGIFSELEASANHTVVRMAAVVTRIREVSESVRTAAAEIARGNIDLSTRTEEQAASIQQTAATMEEFSQTLKLTSENTRQANLLAADASRIALEAGGEVSRAVTTMAEIEASSKRIADIVGVIDGIAFQTNVLALNAAVEAARAGKEGLGFAVVAAEVRSLAQRSAAAAKEVKTLIGDAVTKIGIGGSSARQAGTTMESVVQAVRRVSDIVGEIAAATAEQSLGVDQVGTAVTQMDQMTQQNAALVEQASAAAESLEEQAGELVDAVGVFTLAGAAKASAAPVHSLRGSAASVRPTSAYSR